MKTTKTLSLILLVLFGVFMIVYGGIDDSPGGQLLGLLIAIIGIGFIFKLLRKKQQARVD